MSALKLGIVGCGVVGGALHHWLIKNTEHEILRQDPPLGIKDDLAHVHAAFLCLPVPTKPNKAQDLSLLEHWVESLSPLGVPLFVRSTVLPGTCDSLAARFKARVYAMPEFLTMRRAAQDVASHPILCGGILSLSSGLLEEIFHDKELIRCTNVEAELAKYTHNCFGAIKVGYFNIVYELCRRLVVNYEKVREAAMLTGFIESSHTQVPGPDGGLGFGGACFPKDLSAFVGLLYEMGIVGSGTLQSVGQDNLYYRSKKPHVLG